MRGSNLSPHFDPRFGTKREGKGVGGIGVIFERRPLLFTFERHPSASASFPFAPVLLPTRVPSIFESAWPSPPHLVAPREVVGTQALPLNPRPRRHPRNSVRVGRRPAQDPQIA